MEKQNQHEQPKTGQSETPKAVGENTGREKKDESHTEIPKAQYDEGGTKREIPDNGNTK